jgi:hypothetical protein
LKVWSYGTSNLGRPLIAYSNVLEQSEYSPNATLMIAGIHGDEPGSTALVDDLISRWPAISDQLFGVHKNPSTHEQPLICIPLANPDGAKLKTRHNANNTDLNRNFPCGWQKKIAHGNAPLCEPESKALFHLINTIEPKIILSIHWALSEIESDGPQGIPFAEAWWNRLSEAEKKWVVLSHATRKEPEFLPGSMGHYLSKIYFPKSQKQPIALTLELPYHDISEYIYLPLPNDHWDTVQTIWEKHSKRYTSNLRPLMNTFLQTAFYSPSI